MHPVNIKKVIFFSFGLSLMAHGLLLAATAFRLPQRKISLPPSVNFLGSFLTAYDTQRQTQHPLLRSSGQEKFQAPAEQKKAFKAEEDRPKILSAHITSMPIKKTLKDPRVITPQQAETITAEQQGVAGPFEHLPLKLPDYDRR